MEKPLEVEIGLSLTFSGQQRSVTYSVALEEIRKADFYESDLWLDLLEDTLNNEMRDLLPRKFTRNEVKNLKRMLLGHDEVGYYLNID